MTQGTSETGIGVCRLEQDAYILLQGPRAREVLQGQATADFRALTGDRAVAGVVCSNRGRAEFDFVAIEETEDRIGLRIARDLLEVAQARLRPYAMLSRVTVDAPARVHIGVWGPGAAVALEQALGITPPAPTARALAANGGAVLGRALPEPAWECVLAPDAAAAVLERLPAPDASARELWQHLELRAGVVRLDARLSGREVPQAWNYDFSGHISFGKGCYTGQEVIARLHYRGESKFRTELFSLDAARGPEPGAELHETGSDRRVGEVLRSARGPGGDRLVLALRRSDAGAVEWREEGTTRPLVPRETEPPRGRASG